MTDAQAINLIQADFDNASNAEVLSDLQAIHDDLCRVMRLKPSTQTLSSIVAGTPGYALSAGWARVFGVRYFSSATDYTKLKATDKDELDSFRYNWRLESGTPDSYYIESGNIYLVPSPDTSSSGGYPKVEVDISSTETLSGSGTNLPSGVSSYRAWIEGAKWLIALRYQDPRTSYYEKRYEDERKKLFQQVQQASAEFKPRFIPVGQSSSYRVRR